MQKEPPRRRNSRGYDRSGTFDMQHPTPDEVGWVLDEYDFDRFWSQVDFDEDPSHESDPLSTATGGCWLWPGVPRGSYGQFRHYGYPHPAHRVALRDSGAKIDLNLVIDHLCRTPACVRPSHLEQVTQVENIRRGILGNRTHCKNGHPWINDNLVQNGTTGYARRCKTCFKIERRSAYERSKQAQIDSMRSR